MKPHHAQNTLVISFSLAALVCQEASPGLGQGRWSLPQKRLSNEYQTMSCDLMLCLCVAAFKK